MYEVEMKVRASLATVRERLETLDAEYVGSVEQTDTYYDAPDRNFAETDEALRVRREVPADGRTKTVLTYKGPLVDETSKTREEAETTVGDVDALENILAGLGFEPAATVRKDRTRYRLDGYTVTLDGVENLGEFVEVETETDDDLAAAREGVFETLGRLDLDPEDGIRASYLELLLASDSLE